MTISKYLSILTKDFLSEEYKKLKNFKAIADKYNIPRSTIERYCKIYKIETTPKIEYKLNHSLFSYDTEESFYLAGFIAADGCIFQHKSSKPNGMQINLSKNDESHLLKLKNVLKFSGPIKETSYKGSFSKINKVSIKIYSKQIIGDLARFGIGARKTFTYIMPEWLLVHPMVNHFLRGYFDGDGSLTMSYSSRTTKKRGFVKYHKFRWTIVGTEIFTNQFKNIVEQKINFNSKSKPAPHNQHPNIFELAYNGNILVSKIMDFLYQDSHLFLDRKKNKYVAGQDFLRAEKRK